MYKADNVLIVYFQHICLKRFNETSNETKDYNFNAMELNTRFFEIGILKW